MPAGFARGEATEGAGRLVVGTVLKADGTQDAVIWTRLPGGGWRVIDLGSFDTTPPFDAAFAGDVNHRGQVVVTVWSDSPSGYVWQDGVLHRLKDFSGGTQASPRRINARGQVIGEAYDDRGGDNAAVWDHWWSIPRRLGPAPDRDRSYGQGINDGGVAVGASFAFGPPPDLPTRWSRSGTPTVLADLGHGGVASDVDNSLLTAGWVCEEDGTDDAALWDRTRPKTVVQPLAGNNLARFFGVSQGGRAVGVSALRLPGQPVTQSHLLYRPRRGPVRSLLPLSGNWADSAGAHGVSDARDGTVYGGSEDAAGVSRPTVWTCADRQAVPLPS
jgi:uncharacterized membrane protein